MVDVEFDYKQKKITVQSNLSDIFEEIIEKYINKSKLDINNIYLIANGKIINKEDKLENIMSQSDKRNKKMIILVNSMDDNINIDNTHIKISKDIICPKCKEICKYEIKDYKIKLYDCKNGYITENINLNKYEMNQIVDISQIKCDICKDINKSNTFNNDFYICYQCKMNLCPLCKSIHDKKHSIISYDNKNYKCNKHNEALIQYCNDCNIDICLSCYNEHKNHNITLYQDKLIDVNNLRIKMNEFKNVKDILKINLEEIIKKIKKIIENMDNLYKINNNILDNYENKKRNYISLFNLNYMSKYIENEINNIKDKYNYGHNLNNLLNIEDTKIQVMQNQILNPNFKDDIAIKVTLIGESSVGKTSIINRFVKGNFSQELESTLGANYSQIKIKRHGKKIRLDLWDTAGQEKYRAIGRHFYKESYLICLVYDISNQDSFEKLKSVWYPDLQQFGEKLRILAVVGNKIDKYLEEEVKEEDAKAFAEEIKAINKRTSALDGTNIEDLFNSLVDKYLIEIGGKISENNKFKIHKENHNEKNKKKSCC